MSEELLLLHLASVVPLVIAQLRQAGGPEEWQIQAVRDRLRASRDDGEGEALFYRVEGKTREAVALLTDCLAIMAFQPGGVKFHRLCFEA